MTTKRISALTLTATEADLVAGNHLVVDTPDGTKRLPAGIVESYSDARAIKDMLGVAYSQVNGGFNRYSVVKGKYYQANGYANNLNYACTNKIGAGRYSFAVPDGWQFAIFEYVSDSQGTQRITWRSAAISFNFTTDFIISFRKSPLAILTDADIVFIGLNFVADGGDGGLLGLSKELDSRLSYAENKLDIFKEGVVFSPSINKDVLLEMYFPNITSSWKISQVTIKDDYFRFNLKKPDGTTIYNGYGNVNDGNGVAIDCSDTIVEIFDGGQVIGYIVLHLIDGGYAAQSTDGYVINVDKATDISNSPKIKKYLERKSNLVFIGDSLFGYSPQNILREIAIDLTDKRVFNCGFPGCRAAYRTTDGSNAWDKMSLVHIADCIASGDFSSVESTINSLSSSYKYFLQRVADLKNIDFTKPTTIFINYGNNDITGGSPVGDLWEDGNVAFNKSTFLGAVNYSLQTILSRYPHIKIVYFTPNWRRLGGSLNPDGGTSGTMVPPYAYINPNNVPFMDFVTAIRNNCERSGVRLFDMFGMGGRSAFNFDGLSVDDSHFNRDGYKLFARVLSDIDRGI